MAKEQNTTPETTPSLEPPMTSSGGLDPNQQLEKREVKGALNESLQPRQQDIAGTGASGGSFFYTGQNLVDSRGIIVRTQYSGTYDEAYQELAKMDPAERRGYLNSLYKLGVYGGSKPSTTGFDSRDFNAVSQAMMYANVKGVTLDVALALMASDPSIAKGVGVGGVSVRTTAKQDLKAVFRQSAQQILGRDLPDNEIEKFIRAYQGMETREQTGGATAPAAQVAATEQIEQDYQAEADGVGMMRLAEAFNQAIRGLG